MPERSIYVLGETLIQKCSARSLYPMTVTWLQSKFLYSTTIKMDSHGTNGLYNVLNTM